MNSESTPQESQIKPLRMWPALVLAAIIVLCRYVPRFIEGASSQFWFIPIFFPMLASALMLIWWLAGSRATGREKLKGFIGLIVAVTVIVLLSHASMRGLITSYLTLPLGMVGFGLGAYFNRSKQPKQRVSGTLIGSVLAMSLTLLLRNEGITGDYVFDLQSRWSSAPGGGSWADQTAAPIPAPNAGAAIDAALATAEWPGFRGADRTGRAKAPKLATDWKANPPKLLWKKPVGAGWSSFAVAGAFAFTQEQRGASEVVVCYDLATGNEVWIQEREARFDEPMGGPGPRATPTLADGAVFTASASGLLQRLKASTGEVVWQQDFKKLAGREPPMWGYASSPLVTNSLVIVYAGGKDGRGVIAFDAATGQSRWAVGCGPESYSSPQLSKVLGEETVLMLSNDGLLLLDPATGTVRLNYAWKFDGYRALQPTVIGDDVILLPTPMSEGTRAIRISKKGGQLAAEELWTTKHMKPDFTELIAHKGYLYGIDGSMFSCADLKTGVRVWKDGRYGKGEGVLLEASDQILISAEDGRVVLLQADPSGHKELASFVALKGKTWNHPVLVGDKLLVRNGSEAACYALPVAPLHPSAPTNTMKAIPLFIISALLLVTGCNTSKVQEAPPPVQQPSPSLDAPAPTAAPSGVVTTASGLQYQVLASGPANGRSPTRFDSVMVHYRGTLTDGTVFDSSYDRGQPATFGVGQVIAGWTEALQLMKPGDKWLLHIPARLAYGERAMGDKIPPNSDLIFQVELLQIVGGR